MKPRHENHSAERERPQTGAQSIRQESNKKPEQHALTMLETIPDGVVNLDEQWRFLYVNSVAEQILGQKRSVLLGEVLWEMVPYARGTLVESELRRAMDEHASVEFQTHGIVPGRSYQVLSGPCESGLLVFFRDVTEQNQLKQALKESEAWKTLIFDNVKEFAIFSMDPEGRVTLWNPGAERMFGYPRDEILGERTERIYTPEDRDGGAAEKELEEAKTKGSARDERWHLRKDGARFFVSGAVVPLYDDKGTLRGFTKVARDITDKKKLEDELRTARENLEEKVNERTRRLRETISELEVFSYSLSHDLRTPLRAMKSFAQILERTAKDKLDKKSNEYVERIVSGADRLDRLIQDVLDYSKVSRGQIEIEAIDLDKLVREVVQEQPPLESSKAKIEVQSPLAKVRGHWPSLSQCISNLLTNAVKFVPEGVFPKVRIWTEPRKGRVRLWIEDNGIGIRPESKDRIFGMFEREKAASEYEGTGIGLAIVRKAIDRMGGATGVESEPGKGSRFWLELPEQPTA